MKTTEDQPKIFGIGLNKTGTTTLAHCGEILGYRCTGCDRSLLVDFVRRNDLTRIAQTVRRFDLFEDWPWPLIYKELDSMFPGSKFILTVRQSEEVWLESLKKHSMSTNPIRHCRKFAYGYNYPHDKEQEHIDFYRRHNESARDYFKNRSSDFIELCWENGDGFSELCEFLNRDIPADPFPHANRGADRLVGRNRLLMNRLLSILNY